jgi:hypothetical protein
LVVVVVVGVGSRRVELELELVDGRGEEDWRRLSLDLFMVHGGRKKTYIHL